jgi:hypothetical protein
MICFAKPVLTGLVYTAKGKVFNTCYMRQAPSIFIRDKPILSSERMLLKDYYRKGSVEKEISGRGSQGARRQD